MDHEPTRHDKHVPNHIRALAHYFHSLTEIWEYYRALGNDPPAPFKAEMVRAEEEMLKALEEESNQGGTLHGYYNKQLKEKSK